MEIGLSIFGMSLKNKIIVVLALKSRIVIVGIRTLGLDPEDHWCLCCCDEFQDCARNVKNFVLI